MVVYIQLTPKRRSGQSLDGIRSLEFVGDGKSGLLGYIKSIGCGMEDVQKSQNVEQAKCCHLEKEMDPLRLELANNQR